MDTCEDRPYMPRLNTTYRSNFKELKPTQSLSRDKHNKIRAMRHQFTKRKSDCVELFTNKPLFVFKLLKDKIQIADPLLKQTINYLLEKYEIITSSSALRRITESASTETVFIRFSAIIFPFGDEMCDLCS